MTQMRVVFEYPIGKEREFKLLMPRGAEILGVVEMKGVFEPDYSLVVLVDHNENAGEVVSFHRIAPMEEFDRSVVDFVGRCGIMDFLWVSKVRASAKATK